MLSFDCTLQLTCVDLDHGNRHSSLSVKPYDRIRGSMAYLPDQSQVLSRSLPLVQVSASYVHACRSGQSRPAPPRPLRYGHTSFVNAWLLAALCGSLEGRLSPLASAGGWPSSFLRSAARRSGTGSRTAVYSAASTRPIASSHGFRGSTSGRADRLRIDRSLRELQERPDESQ